LHVHPLYKKTGYHTRQEDELISSISNMISRGKTSSTGLSSEEAAALTKMFREVPLPRQIPSVSDASGGQAIPGREDAGRCSDPWTRLLTHALLRESRVFPGLELCENPPDYSPWGFADIWKGQYHGEPVCIKVVRGQMLIGLRRAEGVW